MSHFFALAWLITGFTLTGIGLFFHSQFRQIFSPQDIYSKVFYNVALIVNVVAAIVRLVSGPIIFFGESITVLCSALLLSYCWYQMLRLALAKVRGSA